jgi:hypothetical protein
MQTKPSSADEREVGYSKQGYKKARAGAEAVTSTAVRDFSCPAHSVEQSDIRCKVCERAAPQICDKLPQCVGFAVSVIRAGGGGSNGGGGFGDRRDGHFALLKTKGTGGWADTLAKLAKLAKVAKVFQMAGGLSMAELALFLKKGPS